MNIIKQTPLAFNIFIPVAVVTVFLLLTMKPKPLQSAEATPAQPKPVVEVFLAKPQAQRVSVRTQGVIRPKREIDVTAQVAGRVKFVADEFVSGGFFANGEPLLAIEDQDFRYRVLNAKAKVADVAKELAIEKGRALQAKKEWRDLGSKTANDLFLRKPQIAAAQASLASANADLSQAELNLDRTQISVPFDGRIREVFADLGQFVAAGTTIARVYDTAVSEVRLPITDKQLALLDLPFKPQSGDGEERALSQARNVTIMGKIGTKPYQWQAEITRTDATIDVESGLYYAIAEIHNAPHDDSDTLGHGQPAVVGLFVEALIEGKKIDNVVSLPKQALFKRNSIYRVNQENKVEIVPVKLLNQDVDHVWVTGNIEENDAIIIGKQNYLMAGTEVVYSPIAGSDGKFASTSSSSYAKSEN